MAALDIHDDADEQEAEVETGGPGCLVGLARLAVVAAALALLLIALLPSIGSMAWARRWMLARINARLAPAELSMESWSLGWFRPPRLEQIRYMDPASGLKARATRARMNRGLIGLLPVGRLNLGEVTIEEPVVEVSLLPPPVAVEPPPVAVEPPPKEPRRFFLPVADLAGAARLTGGRVEIAGTSPDIFKIEALEGRVAMDSLRTPMAVEARARRGGGVLTLQGRLPSLRDLTGSEKAEQTERLTMSVTTLDLRELRPLIEQVAGEPWVAGGQADGALEVGIAGARAFTVAGGLRVGGLSVAAAGQTPSTPGDLSLELDVSVAGKEATIRRFDLKSPWVGAEISGMAHAGAPIRLHAIEVGVVADLAAIFGDFGSALGLAEGFAMQRGQLRVAADLTENEKGIEADVAITATDLEMTVGGEPLVLSPAPSLVLKGLFPDEGLPDIETLQFKAPFADIHASGRMEQAVVKARLDLTRFSRDFRRILSAVPPMVGALFLDATTRQGDGRIAMDAFLNLSDVAAELRPGQRLVVSRGTLKASGWAPMPGDRPLREIREGAFEMTLAGGRLGGSWNRLAPPSEADPGWEVRGLALAGDLELSAVRELIGGFLPAAAQKRLREWQGRVIANATAEARGGVVSVRMNGAGQEIMAKVSNGVWRVPDIRVEGALSRNDAAEDLRMDAQVAGSGGLWRDGRMVFAEPALRLNVAAALSSDRERLRLSTIQLDSGVLGVKAQAEITEWATRRFVQAEGDLTLDFGAISALLEANGLGGFALAGREARPFRLTGPLGGGLATLFGEGSLTGAAHVASLRGFGFQADPADVSLDLSDGRLRMTYAPRLNEGQLRLIPELRIERGIVALSLPDGTRLLDNVRLTQEMLDTLLVHVNPLFQGSRARDGRVTVELASCRLATGQSPGQGVSAEINAEIRGAHLELGEPMRDLLGLLRVREHVYREDLLSLRVVVRDGRMRVDPIRLTIDGQPLIMSGSVGFDRTLQYQIEAPLTDRLTGGVGSKLLKGRSVKIPVTGTLDRPSLDTRELRRSLADLAKEVIREEAAERVGTFLDRLQEELKR